MLNDFTMSDDFVKSYQEVMKAALVLVIFKLESDSTLLDKTHNPSHLQSDSFLQSYQMATTVF